MSEGSVEFFLALRLWRGVVGLYEGSRDKAARKIGARRRFFLARLKPCPDERLFFLIFFAIDLDLTA